MRGVGAFFNIYSLFYSGYEYIYGKIWFTFLELGV